MHAHREGHDAVDVFVPAARGGDGDGGVGVPVGSATIGDSGDPDRSAVLEAVWSAVHSRGAAARPEAETGGGEGRRGPSVEEQPPVSKRRGRGTRQRKRRTSRDEL